MSESILSENMMIEKHELEQRLAHLREMDEEGDCSLAEEKELVALRALSLFAREHTDYDYRLWDGTSASRLGDALKEHFEDNICCGFSEVAPFVEWTAMAQSWKDDLPEHEAGGYTWLLEVL